jgi:glycosyltransferase involved in cell wall biosynthesis
LRVGVLGLAKQPETFLVQLFDGLRRSGVDVRTSPRGADVLYLPWTATAVDRPEVFDLGPPVVISCRGAQVNVAPWNPERSLLRAGLPGAFERAAAVHCVSAAIRAEAGHFGLDPHKATVIRPAVDLDRFRPGPLPGRGALVSVGRLQWRKGYEYSLLAVRRLVDRGHELTYRIVGEEADGGATRHAVHDLDLTGVVELVPPTGHDDVAAELQRADALLLPSLSEGIANSALEAMACGRPVVVTDSGGMAEAVTDGVEGRVVPVRDPEAMAAAIATLDPGMGAAGRARVEHGHDLRDQVAAFAELFRSVAT